MEYKKYFIKEIIFTLKGQLNSYIQINTLWPVKGLLYSWPLNNVGLDCVGSLTCKFFQYIPVVCSIHGWESMEAEG